MQPCRRMSTATRRVQGAVAKTGCTRPQYVGDPRRAIDGLTAISLIPIRNECSGKGKQSLDAG